MATHSPIEAATVHIDEEEEDARVLPAWISSSTSMPVEAAPSEPLQQKQGGKCCFCCDYRRAVIILSLLGIFVGVVGLMLEQNPYYAEDDDLQNELDELQKGFIRTRRIIGIYGLVMFVVNIFGAILYLWPACACYVLYSMIYFVLMVATEVVYIRDLVDAYERSGQEIDDDEERAAMISAIVRNTTGGVIVVLWMYPTFWFMIEVRHGIMSKETYHREEYSCFCTKQRNHQ